jgi:hypothetical protein
MIDYGRERKIKSFYPQCKSYHNLAWTEQGIVSTLLGGTLVFDMPAGYEPVAAPPWLEAALAFKATNASRLIDAAVAVKFPEDDGGWCVGQITSLLQDEAVTETVQMGWGLQELPKNFAITYTDGETVEHLLKIEEYASSFASLDGSWVLLASKKQSRGRGKGKAKATDLTTLTEQVAALSEGDFKKLLEQIQKRYSETQSVV